MATPVDKQSSNTNATYQNYELLGGGLYFSSPLKGSFFYLFSYIITKAGLKPVTVLLPQSFMCQCDRLCPDLRALSCDDLVDADNG